MTLRLFIKMQGKDFREARGMKLHAELSQLHIIYQKKLGKKKREKRWDCHVEERGCHFPFERGKCYGQKGEERKVGPHFRETKGKGEAILDEGKKKEDRFPLFFFSSFPGIGSEGRSSGEEGGKRRSDNYSFSPPFPYREGEEEKKAKRLGVVHQGGKGGGKTAPAPISLPLNLRGGEGKERKRPRPQADFIFSTVKKNKKREKREEGNLQGGGTQAMGRGRGKGRKEQRLPCHFWRSYGEERGRRGGGKIQERNAKGERGGGEGKDDLGSLIPSSLLSSHSIDGKGGEERRTEKANQIKEGKKKEGERGRRFNPLIFFSGPRI